MFRTSMLAQEESRIFEELLSRFDSLGDEQMLAVGVTPEWSAKDLLAHLAYWERAAAEQVRALNAGTWSPKKRTREESCRSIGKLQRRTERPRAVFFARNSTWEEAKSCRRYEWHRTRWRRPRHSRGSSVRSVSVTGATISRNFVAG